MSEEFPHLARAPITEALLDVRVEPNPAASVDAISAAFRARLGGAFPEAKPIQQMHAQLAFGGEGDGGVAAAAQETIGHIFWTADHKRAVQARADGFSVNHVGDYKDWDAIVADAHRYWREYLAAAAPLRVIRCAARFINRIEVPAGDDLRRHLQTRPEIGEQLPPLMEEYFMRVVLPFSDRRRAVITQATIPEAVSGSGRRSLLLDIDAFAETSLAPDGAEIWAEFEELRIAKNRCFFQSLQPDTWRAYQ
jgi:uncharacterized protein (TIGR04255 family)